MLRLSIVIPVYNVSPYLRRGLDSVLAQGLEEGAYEVLLINDGSTDNSLEICEQYARQYPEIFRVISKQNEGVSATRNLGIAEARGEYISFIDPDDYLTPGGLGRLLRQYHQDDIDMLLFGSVTLREGEEAAPCVPEESRIVFDGMSLDCLKHYRLNFSVCNMIVRKAFLLQHQLSFEHMYIAEDVLFNLECTLRNCRIRVVSDCIYHYMVRSTSAIYTRSPERMRQAIDCFICLFDKLDEAAARFDDAELTRALVWVKNRQIVPFISRALSAGLSPREFRELAVTMRGHLAPLPPSRVKSVVSMLCRFPALYPLAAVLYAQIFMRFIYPRLNKN